MGDSKKDESNDKDKINLLELDIRNIEIASTIKGKNVKTFLNVIKSLQFTNNTELQFSRSGMKFIAEESQFFQGVAFFTNDFFHKFHYVSKNELLFFGVDFTAFTEFASAIIDNNLASLKIIYYGNNRPVAFIFTQFDNTVESNNDLSYVESNQEDVTDEIVTEYIIRSKNSINPIDFTSIDIKISSTFGMKASEFIDIISDLDKMAEEIQIKIENHAITFKSLGIIQCNTQIVFPTDHKVFIRFQHHENTKFAYKFSCLRAMLKALSMSIEASFETRENGLLKVQLMGKSIEEEKSIFYEFNILSSVEENDEDINVD